MGVPFFENRGWSKGLLRRGELYIGKTIPEIFPGVRRFFTLNKKLIKSILVD